MRSPFGSTSSDPLIEAPPPSMTMSSRRVDCAVGTTLKLALPALPGSLTQPGRMLSSLTEVRSASMPSFVVWSGPPAILPDSLIGTDPLTAGPRSNPRRARLASSSVVCSLTSASPSAGLR